MDTNEVHDAIRSENDKAVGIDMIPSKKDKSDGEWGDILFKLRNKLEHESTPSKWIESIIAYIRDLLYY